MSTAVLTEELAAVLRVVGLAAFCEGATIAKSCGRGVGAELDQLHAAGLVMRQAARRIDHTRTTLFTISPRGRQELLAFDAGFGARAASAVPSVAAVRSANAMVKGVYAGAELQPYAGRPGAMDAFALPSRMGNRLHFRSGDVYQIASPHKEEATQ